jgi:hypothetical protein
MSIRAVVFFAFIVALLASADKLPSTQFRCDNANVVSYLTSLPNTTIDDWNINYVSPDGQIVFIRTHDGNIWRSSDEGKTWERQTVNAKMRNIGTHGVRNVFTTRSERGAAKMYFVGAGDLNTKGQLWTTSDLGKTYNYYESPDVPSGIRTIYPHPLFQDKALARRERDLFYTDNFGKTWSLVHGDMTSYNVRWTPFPEEHPDRIYATVRKSELDQHLVYSDDFFKTETIVLTHVVTWGTVPPNKMFVVRLGEDGQEELMISDDTADSFRVAAFPRRGREEYDENGFYIYDTSEDSLMIYVNRGTTFWWGDVYKSNSYDTDFVLSLENHRFPDFTRYHGLDGIYLANQYNTTNPMGPAYTDDVVTKITFNKGGVWSPIAAPEKDADGKPTNCKLDQGCSLHLHGFSSSAFTWFYSVPNAIGLMMATGNLGDELLDRPDQVNTYFSRDGGVSWREVHKGSFVPEFGDHGGIIVMADALHKSSKFLFTVDEGKSWHECQFTDSAVEVTNIRIAPKGNSQKFILYGELDGASVLAQLDFSGYFSRNCNDADYEEWSPTDLHGNCVLGEKNFYRRRKQDANCWNGDTLDRLVRSENCTCVVDDYECDFCFAYDTTSQRCVFDCFENDQALSLLPAPPAKCGDDKLGPFYEVQMGYRKVEDDTCDVSMQGSLKLQDLRGLIPCSVPINRSPSGTGLVGHDAVVIVVLAITFTLVGLGVIILGAFIVYRKSERFRNFITYTFNTGDQAYRPVTQEVNTALDDDLTIDA